MRRRVALFAAIALGGLLGPMETSAQAPPQDPLCGSTIRASLTLDRDVHCDSALALRIGAPNITLDLGGHTVSAGGIEPGKRTTAVLNPGYDRVSIRNGTIYAEHLGLHLVGAQANRLRDLDLGVTLGQGIVMEHSDRNVITSVHIAGYLGGFWLSNGSDRNTIRNSQIDGVTGALSVGRSDRNFIFGNHLTGESSALTIASGAGNLVLGNRVQSLEDGIFIGGTASRTVLVANQATESEDGIDVEAASTRLWFNAADNNRDYGIEAVPGVFGFGNTASGNGNPAQCLNVRCR